MEINTNQRDAQQIDGVIDSIRGVQVVTMIRISSEIMERAATKDRPEPTYGTVTKVEIEGDFTEIIGGNADALTDVIASVHQKIETGLQAEIARRVIARAAAGIADEAE